MITGAMISKMLELPDDKLIAMLKILLLGMGADTSSLKIDKKTLSKVRRVLAEITDDDLERIGKLTEVYKNG